MTGFRKDYLLVAGLFLVLGLTVVAILTNSNQAVAQSTSRPVTPVDIVSPRPVPVQQAAETAVLFNRVISGVTDTNPNNNPHVGTLDTSDFKTVRVIVSGKSCGPCGSVGVWVFSHNGLDPQFIDEFNVTDSLTEGQTRVYDVPGLGTSLFFYQQTVGASNDVLVSVLGRTN